MIIIIIISITFIIITIIFIIIVIIIIRTFDWSMCIALRELLFSLHMLVNKSGSFYLVQSFIPRNLINSASFPWS